jgi:hypothetical protein
LRVDSLQLPVIAPPVYVALPSSGEPMRRHHVIPLDHPIPATTEPNPSSLPATKPATQPSESPELEPAK